MNRRTTPTPVFMSSEYRNLIERLTVDANRYGLRPMKPVTLTFPEIVEDLYQKNQYSTELAMYSGSEALEMIEATLSDFIDYPEMNMKTKLIRLYRTAAITTTAALLTVLAHNAL